MTEIEGPTLFWDSTYEIALALQTNYPNLSPEDVGILQLAALVENLPGFADDPELANERILADILTAWFEELNS